MGRRMPLPDPTGRMRTPRRRPRNLIPDWMKFALLRRRRDKDLEEGGVPVEPNRPNTLSGGAAAPLEYDE